MAPRREQQCRLQPPSTGAVDWLVCTLLVGCLECAACATTHATHSRLWQGPSACTAASCSVGGAVGRVPVPPYIHHHHITAGVPYYVTPVVPWGRAGTPGSARASRASPHTPHSLCTLTSTNTKQPQARLSCIQRKPYLLIHQQSWQPSASCSSPCWYVLPRHNSNAINHSHELP